MACCPPPGAEPFTTSLARRDARRYRRKGLDPVSRLLLRLAAPQGRSLLEIGSGVGALQIEALRAGAITATSVELTPTYEDQAAELLADQGLAGRAPRVVADLLASPDAVPEADVVLLNRVVCCTERPAELLAVAARHAGERLVFSFPRDVWWLRSAQRTVNLLARVLGWDWRFRVYHPGDLFAAVTDAGLRLDRTEHGRVWQVALLVRSAGCVQARLS